MYLPKSQYIADKLSELKDKITEELDTFKIPEGNSAKFKNYLKVVENLKSGNPDIILTATGEIFSSIGVDLEKGNFSNAIQLFPIDADEDKDEGEDLNAENRNSEEISKSLKLPPTTADRSKGVVKRCFYYNKCTGKASEISKPQLKNIASNKDHCTVLTTADWYIKGPAKDRTINGYFLEGIETVNNRTIQEIKKTIPVIEALIKSPLEYVEDTFIPSSTEYKPQINDIVIPSPGKEL